MTECRLCKKERSTMSAKLGYCAPCLKERYDEIKDEMADIHASVRTPFGLPSAVPREPEGLVCDRCLNACRIGDNSAGYCGLRRNLDGRLVGGDADSGRLSWYHDPLPTNCVADWVCPGGTGAGYPEYSRQPGPERGCYNLAVFYEACSFNCLFCQNWHFKRRTREPAEVSAATLAAAVTKDTSCICYFGGDPTPQIVHSIETSRLARENRPDGILRICWETNGSMAPRHLDEMIELALESGGCIKFDLKAHSPTLHRALCGVDNRRTLSNFVRAAKHFTRRREPPLIVAGTLLVPGYVDANEVSRLAGFIARKNPDIPYSLLAFYPQFYLDDLPTTSRQHAYECLDAAREAGLKKVRIGNLHLLRDDRG